MSFEATSSIQSLIFVFIDFFIFIKAFSNRKRSEAQRAFNLLTFSALGLQTMSFFVRLIRNDVYNPNVVIKYIIYILLYMFIALPANFCFEYLILIRDKNIVIPRKRELIILIPSFVISILAITTPLSHLVFYFEGADNTFKAGPLFFMSAVCPAYYFLESLILMIVVIVRKNDVDIKRIIADYSSFLIPAIAGAILQLVIKSDSGYANIGVSVGLIFLYIQIYVDEVAEMERLKAFEDINRELIKANAEKEEKLREIGVLNSSLQEKQARLEEVFSEQESQLDEISKLNNLLYEEKEVEKTKNTIISSLGNMFFCIYNVDLESGTYVAVDVKSEKVKKVISDCGNARDTLSIMAEKLISPDFGKIIADFTNLDTVSSRLKNRSYISQEFIGQNTEWLEGFFIAGERDDEGNCIRVLWAIRTINDFKEREKVLIENSYRDKLTNLYNRRMYEENLMEYPQTPVEENFAIASIDVNGLKRVNDSFGHDAGDELLKGAAECLKQCLGSYGRLYRTGGDEFIAIFFADAERVKTIEADLRDISSQWVGSTSGKLSLSVGFVTKSEFSNSTVSEMVKIADARMYEDKNRYYRESGLERRRY